MLAIAPQVACAQADRGSPNLMQQAERARRTGQYPEAIAFGERVLNGDSSNAGAARLVMRSLIDLGRYDDAIAMGSLMFRRLSRASVIDVPLGDAHRSRGQMVGAV